MIKPSLLTILICIPTLALAKNVETMSTEQKCEVFKKASVVYMDNYFNGQSREQQHGFIEENVKDKESAELIKKQIDGIYDNIPLTMFSNERNEYKRLYSSMIFDECMRSQTLPK